MDIFALPLRTVQAEALLHYSIRFRRGVERRLAHLRGEAARSTTCFFVSFRKPASSVAPKNKAAKMKEWNVKENCGIGNCIRLAKR